MSNSQLKSRSEDSGYANDDLAWRKSWAPHALPEARNLEGRPVWEPPILDYSDLIDDEYEKKREAVLKFIGGDVTEATEIMDLRTELDLLMRYEHWAVANTAGTNDIEAESFFRSLSKEISQDWATLENEWYVSDRGIWIERKEDGSYEVADFRARWAWTQHNSLPQCPLASQPLLSSPLQSRIMDSIRSEEPLNAAADQWGMSSPRDEAKEIARLANCDSDTLFTPNFTHQPIKDILDHQAPSICLASHSQYSIRRPLMSLAHDPNCYPIPLTLRILSLHNDRNKGGDSDGEPLANDELD